MQTQNAKTEALYRWIPQGYADVTNYQETMGIPLLIARGEGVSVNDKPIFYAIGYKGKSVKSFFHHSFKTAEHREVFCGEIIKRFQAWEESKKAEAKKRKDFTPTIKAGDVLSASWGYDQTNVEFYLVLEVKGHTAQIQELGHLTVEGSEGFMSCKVMPNLEARVGEVLKKRICYGDKIKINESVRLYPWSGKPNYCSWYA